MSEALQQDAPRRLIGIYMVRPGRQGFRPRERRGGPALTTVDRLLQLEANRNRRTR